RCADSRTCTGACAPACTSVSPRFTQITDFSGLFKGSRKWQPDCTSGRPASKPGAIQRRDPHRCQGAFMKSVRKPLLSLLVLALAVLSTVTASAQTAPYTRTVIVPSNASATTNGTALLAALAGLSPAPSYSNRWLIKLEPGIYNVGTTPVVLQDYVDIEGSGLIESHIQGAFDPTPLLLGGLVRGANNSELRNLTISCVSNATTTSCQALSLDHASPRLSQMRILVQGTGTANHWGIRMLDSAPVLDDVDIQVTTTGAHNYGIV